MKDYSKVPVIYIAGKLNDMAVDYISNVRKMIQVGIEVKRAGFSVIVPCLDILMGLLGEDWVYDDYFDNSQPQVLKCDAVFLCPGWETSSGTAREIDLARENNIPVFSSLETMKDKLL